MTTTHKPVTARPLPAPAPAFMPNTANCTMAAVTAELGALQSASRCPALLDGTSVGRRLAEFTLAVDTVCVDGADRVRAVIEVSGFFCHPGKDHGDDLLQTCLAAPPGSPVAQVACEISTIPDSMTRIARLLRARIAASLSRLSRGLRGP